MKLTFTRAAGELAFLSEATSSGQIHTALTGSVKLSNPTLLAEYQSSSKLRSKLDKMKLITYNYESCDIIMRTLPQNTKVIRIDNLKNGNLPRLMFFGLIDSSNILGDFRLSSTAFRRHSIASLEVRVNGLTAGKLTFFSTQNNEFFRWVSCHT